MTHIEAMKLALEALYDRSSLTKWQKAIAVLHQAIEQAEQAQPVIECDCKTRTSPDGAKLTQCGSDQMRRACEEGHAFVKAPPPRQPQSEVDELIRNLGFDPEQFRTEAGFINHMKLRAAIQHPDEYNAAAQPMYKALANCVFCGRLNPADGSDCKHDDTTTSWNNKRLLHLPEPSKPPTELPRRTHDTH